MNSLVKTVNKYNNNHTKSWKRDFNVSILPHNANGLDIFGAILLTSVTLCLTTTNQQMHKIKVEWTTFIEHLNIHQTVVGVW